MTQTIAQFLKITKFPFSIKNEQGREIYYEYPNGSWHKREFNEQGREIYLSHVKNLSTFYI